MFLIAKYELNPIFNNISFFNARLKDYEHEMIAWPLIVKIDEYNQVLIDMEEKVSPNWLFN